ncbi:MAG: twin-arginine translocase TatA/TatE family subunit [Kiritimatiellae bacterium]|nr:twin-arginine translocase TatA/TatE family subunit [Kiritimatiellia bacterium]MDD5520004.1 twin-arginine translocase TatA/TatE family subunit [Kiritimatiellia bacterium]
MSGLPSGPELIIILFVILLLFGSKKLPELARSIGKSISEFKKGKDEAVVTNDTPKAADANTTKPVNQDNNQQKST